MGSMSPPPKVKTSGKKHKSKKKKKKAKESFKDIEVIDLRDSSSTSPSPAPKQASSSSYRDADADPDSHARRTDKADEAAMPPPARPRDGQKSPPRDQHADLSRAVETPRSIREEIKRRKREGRWYPEVGAQPFSAPSAREPPAKPQVQNNLYELPQRRWQRGDVPPLKEILRYQRVADVGTRAHVLAPTPTPTRAAASTSNSESLQRPEQNRQPAQSSAAVTGPAVQAPTSETTPGSQAPRRNFSTTCKIQVIKFCLASKDMYLSMTPSPSYDQQTFWNNVLRDIEANYATRGKFKTWKDLRDVVDVWVQPRRTSLREGNLPPPSLGQPDLDRVIDEWNKIFVQRFCAVHRGYFKSNIWPLAEEQVLSFVQSEVHSWIRGALKTRKLELERQSRKHLLGSNSTLEDYEIPVRRLLYRPEASNEDAVQVNETEALMSLVIDLQPQLRDIITEQIRNAENEGRPGAGNDQSSDGLRAARDDEQQDVNHPRGTHRDEVIVPSIETDTPARVRGSEKTPVRYPQRRRPQSAREDIRRYSVSPPRDNGISRKRKNAGPSHSSPGTYSSSLAIRGREHFPEYGAGAKTPGWSYPKRQRVNGPNEARTPWSSVDLPSPSQLTIRAGKAPGALRPDRSEEQSAEQSGYGSRNMATPQRGHQHGREATFVQAGQSSSPDWARDAPSHPFETPKRRTPGRNDNYHQSGNSGHQRSRSRGRGRSQHRGKRNAHRHQASSTRFREETAEFHGMTPKSQVDMLYRTLKETRREQEQGKRR